MWETEKRMYIKKQQNFIHNRSHGISRSTVFQSRSQPRVQHDHDVTINYSHILSSLSHNIATEYSSIYLQSFTTHVFAFH